MTRLRQSSRTGANAESPTPPLPSEQPPSSSPSDNNNNNRHDNTDPHEKKDQILEASDPDLDRTSSSVTVSPTASPAVAEELNDAVGTPINIDVQEEPIEIAVDNNITSGDKNKDEDPKEVDDSLEQEPLDNTPSKDQEQDLEHSIELDGHLKNHGHTQSFDTNGGDHLHHDHHPGKDQNSNGLHHHLGSGEVHHSSSHNTLRVNALKHVKRPAEDRFLHHDRDSNTVQDEEEQDYLTGAYKSPFRHTHKAEKAGKEER